MTQLIFHVGDFKTGTTSIQQVLAGGLYQTDVRLSYPAKRDHIWLATALRGGVSDTAAKAAIAVLATKIRHSKADVTILSAEHFQMMRPRRLRDWVEAEFPDLAASARYIAYVRPHAEFLLSTYAEQVKLGVTQRDFPDYLERMLGHKTMNYSARFSRWARVMGDGFSLRAMMRTRLKGGDVVEDFFDTILPGAPVTLQDRPVANRSLGAHDLEFMRHLHSHILSQEFNLEKRARNQLGNQMQAALSAIEGAVPGKLGYTRAQLKTLRGALREDAQTMDRRFFKERVLRAALADAGGLCVEEACVYRTPTARQLTALSQVAPKIFASFEARFEASLKPT